MTAQDDTAAPFTGYPLEAEKREQLEATQTHALLTMSRDLPLRVDPRRHEKASIGFLQVENQGSIGSCQGNSLTECAEFCYMVATGKVIQFSRMFAYIISQMFDRIKGDRGSTLSGGSRAAKDVGFCTEDVGPYPRQYPGWSYVTDAMKQVAKRFKLRTHTLLRSVEATKQFIGSGIGIVQIGISWNNSCNPDRNNCIRRYSAGGGGGHAVVICGYVPDADVGQRSTEGYWFLLKNSWSRRWGDKGYAYVDPAALGQMIRGRHSVFVGRSDMDTPQPRPIPVDFTKPGKSMYA